MDSNEDELGAALLDEPPQKGEGEREMDGGEGEGDRQVLELERMMIRMRAVKGKSSSPFASSVQGGKLMGDVYLAMGQDMPQVARKRFAAKAVRDILGSDNF